mmetsp:Transcript_23409/g.42269  ORF Transcript_23409/g.42269 Transcript_23409/m.42269 type:complete len:111 (+) Transcript_23409:62-394(+)|eukprot:CAMPEP_0197663176 /NCGR_PEP_ID=MMETSP1338-20131121/56397_1 /TAXON_ID=43686 ORGANISM="Pelagodinium beii, Strain RCC1491" /NCGR_SAMPLE_ID=MMETSP1338 /ASSEMBLY_ACC=CAM_ASM_000754 /LENGTH=110 /DNA_ID=CAMNT_0043241415 /DNA_START=50 /DNA_END=382 /DNA_ORIENTATION=+
MQMQLWAFLALGFGAVPNVALVHVPANGQQYRVGSLMQMSSSLQRSGQRLHYRRQRVKAWSSSCAHLPVSERAACEREVDKNLLHEKIWERTDPHAPIANADFSLKLEHD